MHKGVQRSEVLVKEKISQPTICSILAYDVRVIFMIYRDFCIVH